MNRSGTTKKRVTAQRDIVARARVLSIANDTVRVRCDDGATAIDRIGAGFGIRISVSGPYWKCAATVLEDVGDGELLLDLQDIDLDTKVVDLRPLQRLGT